MRMRKPKNMESKAEELYKVTCLRNALAIAELILIILTLIMLIVWSKEKIVIQVMVIGVIILALILTVLNKKLGNQLQIKRYTFICIMYLILAIGNCFLF